MAKFYGTLQGDRGAVTRTGNSFVRAAAQSYSGSVIHELSYNNEGTLMIRVDAQKDESTTFGRLVFYGTFDEYIAKLQS